MRFDFTPMTETDARAILAWRYSGPYAIYNASELELNAGLAELLDPRSPYFAVREVGQEMAEPVGFFAYGSAGEVGADDALRDAAPYLLRPDGSLTIGLGLRPDLTGQGHGLSLVETGLAYARDHYHPSLFRLYVFAWNMRAIRVYERAGFTRVGVARLAAPEGERIFAEMTRPV